MHTQTHTRACSQVCRRYGDKEDLCREGHEPELHTEGEDGDSVEEGDCHHEDIEASVDCGAEGSAANGSQHLHCDGAGDGR